MKYLAIPQIFFGLAVAFFSWLLAEAKTPHDPIPKGDSLYADFIPPSSLVEFILLGLGLTVLIFGLLQWKAGIKGSVFQAILGGVLVIVYTFLGVRATNLSHGEISAIYYLAYFSLTIGVAVSAIGVIQLTTRARPTRHFE